MAESRKVLRPIPDSLGARFANMGVVCTFFVVCMHVGGELAEGTLAWWVGAFTRGGISRIAVPYFFLAGGFFLAGKYSDSTSWMDVWRRESLKRVRSLLVPLVLWPYIGMFFAAPFTMIANRMAGRPTDYAVPFMNGVWWPGVGILWFVQFLFVLALLALVLFRLIKASRGAFVALAFAVYWCVSTTLDPVAQQGPLAWTVYRFSLAGESGRDDDSHFRSHSHLNL